MFCLNCAAPLSGPPAGAAPPVIGQPTAAAGTGQKATIALVLAIAALVCCGPFAGIPAAIVGWMELDAINKGTSPAGGKWMAQVGLWGGIITSVLHIIGYIIWILLSMMAASNPYAYY
ncbi:MAG: DUF4190 domain-containing protein [Acidobacteria bacterium]|nr:DUF4190 domain-containing protein [Acidobacteriota bacterium]